jgi:hypothetical protein
MWSYERSKIARRCGAKHISKPKVLKTDGFGALFEVEMLQTCTASWCEAHLEVKTVKAPHADARPTFGRSDVVLRGRRKGLCTFPKVGKKVRVLWQFQKRWQAWDI